MILIGGVGGGGDSAGALSLALDVKEKLRKRVAILGMVRVRVKNIEKPKRIIKGIVEVKGETWASGRFFEPRIASLGWETYVVCLEEKLDDILEGLRVLVEEKDIKHIVCIDFGGDVLIRGNEPELGSPVSDAIGLAVLAEAKKKLGLHTILGIGNFGAEFGGVIPIPLLVENLQEIAMAGGYYGAYKPPKEVLPKFFMYTEYLRKRVPSFMLNVYLDALKGKFGKNRYRVAYFNGVFKVEPYHRFIFMVDPIKACSLNTLCTVARKRRNVEAVKKAVRYRKVKKRKGVINWEKALQRFLKKKWSPEMLR